MIEALTQAEKTLREAQADVANLALFNAHEIQEALLLAGMPDVSQDLSRALLAWQQASRDWCAVAFADIQPAVRTMKVVPSIGTATVTK